MKKSRFISSQVAAVFRCTHVRGWYAVIIQATCAVLLVCEPWVRNGLRFYPLNDGWVSLSNQAHFQFYRFIFGSDRDLRIVPFMIAKSFPDHVVQVLNIELILLDVTVFAGLYFLTRKVLRATLLESFFVASLSFLFPNDVTRYWLGAFGVHISWALMLWSTIFLVVGHKRKSSWRKVIGLIFLFCAARTYSGYIALPILAVAFVAIDESCTISHAWRNMVRTLSLPFLVLFLALAGTVVATLRGAGRSGQVADFQIKEIIQGFVVQAEYLSGGWISDFINHISVQPLDIIFSFCVVAICCVILLLIEGVRSSSSLVSESGRSGLGECVSGRVILVMSFCVCILILGYLPYSVSDIRMGHGRQLILARVGLCMALVFTLSWLSHIWSKHYAKIVLVLFFIPLVVFFCLNSYSIFEERVNGSRHQLVFAADMLEAHPCPPIRDGVLIYSNIGEYKFSNGSMLLNRPQYIMRYFYGVKHVSVASTNRFFLSYFKASIQGSTLRYRGYSFRAHDTAAYLYSFKEGLKRMNKVRLPHDAGAFYPRFSPSTNCQLTPQAGKIMNAKSSLLRDLHLTRTG